MITIATAAASVALMCQLRTIDSDPPMFITLNEASNMVQVTMAGQTYFEDTLTDGSIVWWQVKSRDGTIIRSRLNRADGTLIITNENLRTRAPDQMVEGHCRIAPEAHPLALSVAQMDRQQLPNGKEFIVVTGQVINSTDKSHRVPRIQAHLRNRLGELIHSLIIEPPTAPVPAGKSVTFRSEEIDVPAGGDALTLSFVWTSSR